MKNLIFTDDRFSFFFFLTCYQKTEGIFQIKIIMKKTFRFTCVYFWGVLNEKRSRGGIFRRSPLTILTIRQQSSRFDLNWCVPVKYLWGGTTHCGALILKTAERKEEKRGENQTTPPLSPPPGSVWGFLHWICLWGPADEQRDGKVTLLDGMLHEEGGGGHDWFICLWCCESERANRNR